MRAQRAADFFSLSPSLQVLHGYVPAESVGGRAAGLVGLRRAVASRLRQFNGVLGEAKVMPPVAGEKFY